MRLEILDKAEDDLVEGYQFYENQQPGLGAYFLQSLYSDVESLKCMVAFIAAPIAIFTACSPSGFHLRSFTRSPRILFSFTRSRTAEGARMDQGTSAVRSPNQACGRTGSSAGVFRCVFLIRALQLQPERASQEPVAPLDR